MRVIVTYSLAGHFAAGITATAPAEADVTNTITEPGAMVSGEVEKEWATVYAPAFEPAPKKRTSERSRQAAREMHRRGFRR